ncbi:MAG: hypothetical protein CM1200mP22_11060 [Dehalococcoidia bacterium]|nr:MAG: hypothetical protein CM1200mP22_11060 [Dehalococcoidia bacterium]
MSVIELQLAIFQRIVIRLPIMGVGFSGTLQTDPGAVGAYPKQI